MFDEFDRDHSGSVSLDEVRPALRSLGMSDHQIADLVERHDLNKDGELQYEEFVSFLWES
jgi:Ca2+-binding EF-hand superfamily protein